MHGLLEALAGVGRAPLGVVGAMLPRRYWPALDEHVPASGCALAAGLLTLLAGAALGITGFLEHLADIASQNNDAYMKLAQKVAERPDGGDTLPGPSGMSALALFTFLFLTLKGWVTMYLLSSGLVRAAGAQFDDPHGDLLLTAVDAGLRRAGRSIAGRAEIDNRALLEGPVVPDRVARGSHLDLPEVQLVIVASRIKEGWDRGTVLITESGAYRVVVIEDRTIHGRLRHLYGVNRHEDLEAIRRSVRYDWPEASSPQNS